MRAGSGIVVFDSSFVRIEGLTIHDANLHNLTFWMTENCTAEGLDVFGANDKNIAAVSTHRLRLFDNHAHDSVCEDGIIFYVLGHMPWWARIGSRTIRGSICVFMPVADL